jgi:hypothetical protein
VELALIGLLISFLSFVGAVITAVLSYRYLKRQHNLNGLQDAFKILNNSEHRNFRKKVYELHHEFQETGKLEIFRDVPEVENVRADFDVLGVLIKNKNIDKNLFLREYGLVVYRCWVCLEAPIMDERQRRDVKAFMENFEWLSDEARKFWERRGGYKTKIYDPRRKP